MCRSNQTLSFAFLLMCITLVSCSPVFNKSSATPPLLLLISFDGFRSDYPDIYQLPAFRSLVQRGVHVKHIENNFTVITGLNAETHGLVSNSMYDPLLNATTTSTNLDDFKWWSQNPHAEPIWISNELANDSTQRRSGVIAWPGCSVPINGHLPTRHETYNASRDCRSLLRQALDWFREPAKTRVNFGAVYCNRPDVTGHLHRSMSTEINQTLHQYDLDVQDLLQIIDGDEYLRTNLNVILTFAHSHDNRDPSMQPIFYAFGPAFQTKLEADAFRSVDYYPLMSHILQLQARDTNGSFDRVKAILTASSADSLLHRVNSFVSQATVEVTGWGVLTVACLLAVIVVAVCFTVAACRRSGQLVYSPSQYAPVRYRLLSVTEGSANNLVASESDEEIQ